MSGIAKALRGFVRHQSNRYYIDEGQARWLTEIADEIDAEHERRMDQAKREVRRKMARDMRWAATMLEARESRRHIRDGLEEQQ